MYKLEHVAGTRWAPLLAEDAVTVEMWKHGKQIRGVRFTRARAKKKLHKELPRQTMLRHRYITMHSLSHWS
jgi:hypothetical protein